MVYNSNLKPCELRIQSHTHRASSVSISFLQFILFFGVFVSLGVLRAVILCSWTCVCVLSGLPLVSVL